jgi:myo-inositol 2-dehydrogenase/D-chiro-inositol 1-dehydrogenase
LTIRLGLIGGGWISGLHLEALERLGRTELVGVVAGRRETAETVSSRWGGQAYDELEAMLDGARPEVVYVAVPPHRSVAIGEQLAARHLPFLTEKPLAADDPAGPARLAERIDGAGLVVAVGYHLRALDIMAEVRERLMAAPPRLVVARWLDSTPGPAWWGRRDEGGGQVIEQATHLYDLARWIMGEADVVGAASTRDPAGSPPTVDVADSSAAILRFEDGAIGSFANTRRLGTAVIELEFISDGLLTRLSKRPDRGQGDWHARFDDGTVISAIRAERDPYELQAAAFLDAVETDDPSAVLSTYADALQTDRLTRAVVAATGAGLRRRRGRGRLPQARSLNPASRASTSSIRLPNGSRI